MSKEEKGSKDNVMNNTLIAWCIFLGFLVYLLQKILAILKVFYARHHTQLFYCGAITTLVLVALLVCYLRNKYIDWVRNLKNEKPPVSHILVGTSFLNKRNVYIEELARLYHTEVIGSTGSGKSEGIIMPWIFDDIEKGRGIVIIDGKPEGKTLARLYGKIVKEGREKDFRLFSMVDPELSHSFNPFAYGTAEEVTERIFSSFETTNEHYKSVQYSATSTIISLIKSQGVVPTAGLIRELLRDQDTLREWSKKLSNPHLYADLEKILTLPPTQFQKDFSGILAYLENFTKGEMAKNLNQSYSDINFEEALLNRNIIYFQLPTLKNPTLASNIGRLAIQTFAAAAGEYQARMFKTPDKIFTLYLDDFNDYMYEKFASVANKVRSAHIAMTFAHQSLGDLEKVSPEFKKLLVENTNNKIILKINEPESAEFFAKYIGTTATEKVTERQSKALFGTKKSGEQSVREAEEFTIHPNVFKSEFGPGDAIAIISQTEGVRKVERIKCVRAKNDSFPFMPPKKVHPETTYLRDAKRFSSQKADPKTSDQSTLDTPPKTPVKDLAVSNAATADNKKENEANES